MVLNPFIGMLKPSIHGIDHKRDEDFAFILGEQPLNQRVWNSGESKWIYERKGWGNLTYVVVESVESLPKFGREFTSLNIHLEMFRELEFGNFAFEVIGAIIPFLNEEKDQFPFEFCSVSYGSFQCDDWRSWLAARVSSWPGKAVNIYNPPIVGVEDRKPCVEVFAENLMLGRCVRLYGPDCICRCSHSIIETNTMVLAGRDVMGYRSTRESLGLYYYGN
jgi:hypothetical protein